MIEVTCIECGHKFDKYTGDMDERTCLTCVLKAEDPDVIKGPNLIKQRVDREDYTNSEKNYGLIKDVADKVYDRIEKEEIRPVTYESFIRTGMDNRSYVQLEKKISDNYLLVNDRVNELLERIVVIEKEIRE
tara:strand:- start:190 stop:585 length:396 start_codon:yes stop_codon:yes gene_type:complete